MALTEDGDEDSDEEYVEAEAVELTEIMSRGDAEGNININLPPHLRCASHRLNNVATTDALRALEDNEFKRKSRNAQAKCTALINKQDRSSQSAENVRDKCGKLFEKPNSTRWNSHHRFMNGIRVAIEKSDDNLDGLMDVLGLPRFTEDNVTFIQEYCEIYEPLATILDILQRDKNGFVGMLLPLLSHLEAQLDTLSRRVTICQPLAEALLEGIAKRFDSEFTKDDFYIAAFLHPRFKDSWLYSAEKKEAIWNKIGSQLPRTQGPNTSRDNQRAGQKKDPMDRLFPLEGTTQTPEYFLNTYKSAPRGEVSDLKNFPPLVHLFRKYNTALASRKVFTSQKI